MGELHRRNAEILEYVCKRVIYTKMNFLRVALTIENKLLAIIMSFSYDSNESFSLMEWGLAETWEQQIENELEKCFSSCFKLLFYQTEKDSTFTLIFVFFCFKRYFVVSFNSKKHCFSLLGRFQPKI